MTTYSARTLRFIGGFSQFVRHGATAESQYVVRISDGARYSLPADASDRDDGLLVVSWFGRSAASVQVSGDVLAELAIAADAAHEHAMGRARDKIAEATDLLSHFDWKTTNAPWAPQPPLPEPNPWQRFCHWITQPATLRRGIESVSFGLVGFGLRSFF